MGQNADVSPRVHTHEKPQSCSSNMYRYPPQGGDAGEARKERMPWRVRDQILAVFGRQPVPESLPLKRATEGKSWLRYATSVDFSMRSWGDLRRSPTSPPATMASQTQPI